MSDAARRIEDIHLAGRPCLILLNLGGGFEIDCTSRSSKCEVSSPSWDRDFQTTMSLIDPSRFWPESVGRFPKQI